MNGLKWEEIANLSPSFKQCVDKPTRKDKTLSIIITDLHEYYEGVRIFEPLEPDDPNVGEKVIIKHQFF